MATFNFKRTLFALALLMAVLYGLSASSVWAQTASQDEDTDKTIEPNLRRTKAAPGQHSPKTQPARRRNGVTPTPTPPPAKPKPVYRVSKDSTFDAPPPPKKINALIGVTVFRRKKDQAGPFSRIEDNTPLAPDDEVQIDVESGVGGYLYVVSRELYSDGTRGRSLLIFPTPSTYAGDNRITPGLPRVIPGPDSVLAVVPKNEGKTQVAESLTIIIAPKPLKFSPLVITEDGYETVLLTDKLMDGWEKQWEVRPARASLVGGAGQARTPREEEAGNTTSKELRLKKQRVLREDDPAPQNLYQVTMTRGVPVLMTVNLRAQGAVLTIQ